MKITIITVCFNAVSTINDTLESVASQMNADVEHIVVDGGSTDGTKEVIQQHSSVNKFISEPDAGIYDAMNKGIKIASGDVVGILNADDFYMNNDVIAEVAKTFDSPDIEASYADLVYVDQVNTNQVVRYWKSQPYRSGLFKTGWMPAHPTFFVRRTVYEKHGLFDLSYKIAADFDLLFRFIEKNKITTKYIPKILVKMRLGGTTNKSFNNILVQNKEIVKTLQQVYPDFSLLKFVFIKLVNRVKQYTHRPKS